jgi:hypothetical protein
MVEQRGDQGHAVRVELILCGVAKFAQALQEQLMGQRHFLRAVLSGKPALDRVGEP